MIWDDNLFFPPLFLLSAEAVLQVLELKELHGSIKSQKSTFLKKKVNKKKSPPIYSLFEKKVNKKKSNDNSSPRDEQSFLRRFGSSGDLVAAKLLRKTTIIRSFAAAKIND